MSNEWYDIDWQWVDNEDAQWGFTTEPPIPGYEGLYQIWTDAQYVYAATTSGLDIIDIDTEQRTSFATNPNGYTTVWASDDQVFLGTNSAGVKVLNKSSIGPAELASQIQDYEREPFLSNNNVRYIHGNENKLICCTIEGVDVIKRDARYVYNTSVSGVQKCFITPEHNYCYYTVSGVSNWQLHRVDDPRSSWQSSDRVYTTGSGFLAIATSLNDFYVTEHTSISGVNNTLFVATDVGVRVYDEGSGDYLLVSTALFAGTSTKYTSIWADPGANINNAKMYVGTTGSGAAFSVIDLEHKVLIDNYTIDYEGINKEVLDGENIVDINVNTAGL